MGVLLGPIGLLGARNTARSPRRTAATSAAVLVGVTLTATMVTGIALLGPAIQSRLIDRVPLDVVVTSPDGVLPEICERADHPWFVGVQFHPELKSRPFDPHPLFTGFIGAAKERSRLV